MFFDSEKIGAIRKRVFVFPDIDKWEFKRKKSKVVLADGEIYKITSGLSKKGRRFYIDRKHWKITTKEDGYVVSYKKMAVAHVYKSFKSEFYENKKWLIGYDALQNEKDLVILVVAIWNMIRN